MTVLKNRIRIVEKEGDLWIYYIQGFFFPKNITKVVFLEKKNLRRWLD